MGFLLFFKSLLSGALTLLGKLWEWCCSHPKAAIAILVLVASNAFMFHMGGVHQEKKDAAQIVALKAEIKKANDETTARNKRITELEQESKVNATALEAALLMNKREMDAIVSDYKRKLAEEKKKNRIVVVKDPVTQKDTQVELAPDGEVVCSRLHDAFSDTVNELVKKANQK